MNRLFTDGLQWTSVADGTDVALNIFRRHYSFRNWRNRNKKNGKRIVGPGERLILISKDHTALFVWRKERYRRDNQEGVNCAVFRNEGEVRSSDLIREAELHAWRRWPRARLFTFVNPRKIRSTNPGCCFKFAGWRRCGTSTKNLLIFEKLPAS